VVRRLLEERRRTSLGHRPYDAEQDTLFWATGNPGPDWNGDVREGDNLYNKPTPCWRSTLTQAKSNGTSSSPRTTCGTMTATHRSLLVNVLRNGHPVKALAQTNRNGYLYVLDRTNGAFLHGAQYVDKLNWSKGLDEKGRPMVDPKFTPTEEAKDFICPGSVGGKNGSYTAAYSPLTKLMYVPVIESCLQMKKSAAMFIQGIPYWGGGPGATQGEDQSSYGHFLRYRPHD